MSRLLLAALAALAFAPTAGPAAEFPLRDGRRVAFLGDSITQAGVYIQDIDAYLLTRFPDRKVELINLGLSSETVSGMTEPGHPYPRPDVRERLGRALDLARPDLVVVCYGMNDGIYHPPGEGRTAAYRKGIEEVVDRARKDGAEVVLGTPPPFDPRPVAPRLRPIGQAEYGFQHPFADYDGVLAGYGDWLLAKRADGWSVVDVHAEVARFVSLIRESDPGFTLARDGVHPDATGHWLIAQAYLKAWDAPAEVDSAVIDARTSKATAGAIEGIVREGGSLAFAWTTRIPMPHDPGWDPRLVARGGVDERFNRHRLVVDGLDRPRYAIFEGDRKVGEVTPEQLAAGLDLLGLPGLSTNRRAAELWPVAAERQRILGAAWLQEVGHAAPVFPKGPTLDEARKRSAVLERRIRELAKPVPIRFRLEPLVG